MNQSRIDIRDHQISEALQSFLEATKDSISFSRVDLADLNVRSDCDDSLLHHAVRFHDDPAIIEELLEHGVDANAIGDMGETPLHVACGADNLDAVMILLRHGARLDITSQFSMTPIEKARHRNHSRIVEYLENWKNKQASSESLSE